ncbi:MAG TPA: ABC transporter ATP-binding protein [Tepidisphaeraceae bacterium]|nr:ABC transporter ATP-binding protein [Tepidisphaeraceae bacterium]
MAVLRSSHRRYSEYRAKLKERRRNKEADDGGSFHSSGPERKKPHKRSRSFFKLFVLFWGLLAEHRRMLVVALATLGVSTLLGLIPLYGTKIVFDSVLRENPLPVRLPYGMHLPFSNLFEISHNGPFDVAHDRRALLTFVAVAMVLLTAAAELFGLWSRWQATRMTKRVQVSVRKRVFDHAVRLPLHRVYELKSGGVASILREDAGGVADLIFSMLYNPWRAIVQLLGSLVVLAFVDWRLLLGSILLLPTVWLTHRTWIGRIRPIFRDIRNTRQGMDSHATEAFGGMRVVRSFSRQQAEAATFTTTGHLMARQEILAWWWMRGIDVAWSILIPVASALLLFFGGMRVLSDMERIRAGLITPAQALTVGDLVMFLAYLAALLGPIATLASSATALQNSLSGLDRVLDLLAEPLEMPNKPDAITVTRDAVAGAITIESLSFTYAGTVNPVLHEINLEAKPGEIVALVGPSGAGKTTLCNLIARFYDPTIGSIKLDGVDLRDITVESYRRLLGIVEQDTFLFDGTIAQNIAYGRRGATMQEVTRAAQLANADEFVAKLKDGYDTLIGERGVKLSGGQRQRLTIARAILADPRILILDEATSNLDTESERLIQGSLHMLMAGRTSFVIAHRLSTIAHADKIVVLENGHAVQQGRHEELMQTSGRYRDMVDLQTAPPAPPKRPTREQPEDAFAA